MNIKILKENMRRFNTKNLLTEEKNDHAKLGKIQIKQKDLAHGDTFNGGRQADTDFTEAAKFALALEEWWAGSNNITNWDFDRYESYHKFFKRYQGFWQDQDMEAATAWRMFADNALSSAVKKENKYYRSLRDWIVRIAQEIPQWFQDPMWLHLKSQDGRSMSFEVDPEIDV